MTAPHPGTREYLNQIVRLSDLTVVEDVIRDVRFEHCQIHGPAVLAFREQVTVSGCQFDAPDSKALFWLIPEDRKLIIGAVWLVNVEFYACSFVKIGLAVPESHYDDVRRGFQLD